MSDWFRFRINSQEVAEKLRARVEDVHKLLLSSVELLAKQAHAFVLKKAETELSGWKLQHFLGEGTKNVYLQPIAKNIWVVGVDESVRWVEEGRPPTSMATEEWLLKGPKVKIAKDGSKYRVIPFTQAQGKGKSLNFRNPIPEVEKLVKQTLKANKISLHKVEVDEQGKAKLGILHRLKIPNPGPGTTHVKVPGGKDWFSKPRTHEMSQLTGLKSHKGIFFGRDVVITQREGPRGGIVREAVTFRTVSSKHQAEGRWMYPAVKPLGSIEAAYEWVQQKWQEMLRDIEQSFKKEDDHDHIN